MTFLGDLSILQLLCQLPKFNGTIFTSTVYPYLYQIIDSVDLLKLRAIDDKNAIFFNEGDLIGFQVSTYGLVPFDMRRVAMYLIHR